MTTNCFVCYDNLLKSPLLTSVTATSARTGYSVQNAYDWYTTSYWSPTASIDFHDITAIFSSAVSSDYFAVYRHNLKTVNCSIYLQYSTNSGSTWTTAASSTPTTDNELILKTFASISATYWRVRVITLTDAPLFIGVIILKPLL